MALVGKFLRLDDQPAVGDTSNQVTYDVLIMDKSGSMADMREQAVSLANDWAGGVRSAPSEAGVVRASCVFFSGHGQQEDKYWNKEKSVIPTLTVDDYSPTGGTALYDAMISVIESLQRMPDAELPTTAFKVSIITDGEENSSAHGADEKLKALMRKCKQDNRWTFVFLVANIDPDKLVKTLSLESGNVQGWNGTKGGLTHASAMGFSEGSAPVGSYYSMRARGGTTSASYFTPEEPESWAAQTAVAAPIRKPRTSYAKKPKVAVAA